MPHPYGWLSLAPPVAAVVLAIVTRRILGSLVAGLFVGAMLTTGGDPVQAVVDLFEVHLWPAFIDPGKLRLFTFTMTMGALVGLLHAGGGMRAFVELFTRWASDRRSGQLTGWGMGLIVFFDDYANTLLLGGALRGVFDRLRVSREKLAYLVDSTAAPVAGLALISTWVAVEIGYVQEGLDNLPLGEADAASSGAAFGLFVACLPYRFYVIQALLFVPLVAVLGRDFGPMLSAERRALSNSNDEPDSPQDDTPANRQSKDAPPRRAHWLNAIVPLLVMLAAVMSLLWATGMRSVNEEELVGLNWSAKMRTVLGGAESSLALQYGALSGLGVALLLTFSQRLLPAKETQQALVKGMLTVLPAVAILWLAATMSRMTGNRSIDGAPTAQAYEFASHRLYTAEFLSVSLLGTEGDHPTDTLVTLLPTGVFLMSGVVAFCTGTSFGTMGLVVPIVVPLAFSAAGGGGEPVENAMASPLLLASLGGVLAGAIFGDHCSPISDTTILSSQACGCDHMAHVRTQLPYAMVIAVVSVLLGTVPIGFGVNVWLLLPLQTAALVGVLLLLGKRPTETED